MRYEILLQIGHDVVLLLSGLPQNGHLLGEGLLGGAGRLKYFEPAVLEAFFQGYPLIWIGVEQLFDEVTRFL